MAHCVSDMLESNTSRVSSQVNGDSTAQTVMTKSIGFMPEIPGSVVQTDIMEDYANRPPWFQQAVKVSAVFFRRSLFAMLGNPGFKGRRRRTLQGRLPRPADEPGRTPSLFSLFARRAGVHVDFHAHRHFHNLRGLPSHSGVLPSKSVHMSALEAP